MANKANPLTAERVRFVLSYNPTTGDLTWRNPSTQRIAIGDKAGALAGNGRLYVGIDGHRVMAHRLLWLYVHGVDPVENISAKNGDYTDLRLENYEIQTTTQTSLRNQMRSTNKSGMRGVIWDKQKKKWRAEITRDYRKVFLGRFNTKEEAEKAYFDACRTEAKPESPQDRQKAAAAKLRDSRVRRLWNRTIRDCGGVVGWPSYEDFKAHIGTKDVAGKRVEPLVIGTMAGPENYQLVANSVLNHLSKTERAVRDRLHRAQNPEVYKNMDLKRSFGITIEQYREMQAAQKGLCAICGRPEEFVRRGKVLSLAVDHCHHTNAVRDLLCNTCNRGIGSLKDDPALLRAAADYIERHAAKHKSVPASNVIQLKQKER